ncbi:uncharacterized protein [Porites lutea]|uniref:uncharacterized protein n=1 Tax=Porites lutea TaxID=51062 RepID=UPI003CC57BAA
MWKKAELACRPSHCCIFSLHHVPWICQSVFNHTGIPCALPCCCGVDLVNPGYPNKLVLKLTVSLLLCDCGHCMTTIMKECGGNISRLSCGRKKTWHVGPATVVFFPSIMYPGFVNQHSLCQCRS